MNWMPRVSTEKLINEFLIKFLKKSFGTFTILIFTGDSMWDLPLESGDDITFLCLKVHHHICVLE